jgi:quinoprotein glucose dehydrogenase
MFEATPVVADGVMYLSTPHNQVVVLEADSGRELWTYDPEACGDGQVPNGTGFVHRGVALWRDARTGALRVLTNSRYRLIELNARTGVPVVRSSSAAAASATRSRRCCARASAAANGRRGSMR